MELLCNTHNAFYCRDKPIMFDYWTASCIKVITGVRGGEKLLVEELRRIHQPCC